MEDTLQNNSEIHTEVNQSNPEVDTNLQQDAQVEHKTTPQESFQELRMRSEQMQKERDEAFGFIRQLEQQAIQQQYQQQQQYAEPEPSPVSYDDDDIIEGRHIKPELAAIKKELQHYRQQMEEARRVTESSSIENKLRSKYNDFDTVVTKENIERLRELKPEIAASLHQTQDIYSKAAATYSILKDLGISRSQSNYSHDHLKAQNNLNKPKNVAAIASQSSNSPLTHASSFSAGDLSDERKRQIWTQMQENARRK